MNKASRLAATAFAIVAILMSGCNSPINDVNETPINGPNLPGMTQLATPILTLDGKLVAWQPVQGTDRFIILVDDVPRLMVGGAVTQLHLSDAMLGLTPGATYRISLVAAPAENCANFSASETSNAVTVRMPELENGGYDPDLTQLAAPQLSISGDNISWNSVQGAAGSASM